MKGGRIGTTAVLTLSLLLSGDILFGLYYRNGSPILGYVCCSAILVVMVVPVAKFFTAGKKTPGKFRSRLLAVLLGVFLLIPFAYTVSVYARKLGSFARYYSHVQVVVFAVLFAVMAGIITAKKGEVSVSGFARLTAWTLLIWLMAGLLGFAHTKNVVVQYPLYAIDKSGVLGMLKNSVLQISDVVFVLAVVTDNKSASEKKRASSQVVWGTVIYIAVSGLNMLKNTLMFGGEFVSLLDNPDLAAARLIPMFELPEVGVIVNSVAVTLRSALYICGMFYVLKDSFGSLFSAKKASEATFVAVCTLSVVFIFVEKIMNFTENVYAIGLAMCTIILVAYFFAEKNAVGDGM